MQYIYHPVGTMVAGSTIRAVSGKTVLTKTGAKTVGLLGASNLVANVINTGYKVTRNDYVNDGILTAVVYNSADYFLEFDNNSLMYKTLYAVGSSIAGELSVDLVRVITSKKKEETAPTDDSSLLSKAVGLLSLGGLATAGYMGYNLVNSSPEILFVDPSVVFI